jgi:hypothetical protein
MRGNDDQLQSGMFSYVSLEERIPTAHPLRGVRKLADAVLAEMSKDSDGMYAKVGRPSIPPERLFRALLLQVFYSVRSERLLMEQLDYNLLFRWFVGLEIDEPVWNHAVFSKTSNVYPPIAAMVLTAALAVSAATKNQVRFRGAMQGHGTDTRGPHRHSSRTTSGTGLALI